MVMMVEGAGSNICSELYLTSQDWNGQGEREQNKKKELHNRKKTKIEGDTIGKENTPLTKNCIQKEDIVKEILQQGNGL